jgi:hypothetical protein
LLSGHDHPEKTMKKTAAMIGASFCFSEGERA